jgi:hypothetical protein
MGVNLQSVQDVSQQNAQGVNQQNEPEGVNRQSD